MKIPAPVPAPMKGAVPLLQCVVLVVVLLFVAVLLVVAVLVVVLLLDAVVVVVGHRRVKIRWELLPSAMDFDIGTIPMKISR